MKEDEEDDQPICSSGAGGTAPAGKIFHPSDPTEDAAAPADTSGPTKAVPIGRPISEAEYSRRKERAADDEPPPGGRPAQEDPAHHERDE